MSRVLLCLAALGIVLTGCSPRETAPELRWRFLGGQVLRQQTNAPALRDVLLLPQASALAAPLAEKLAHAWWNFGTGMDSLPPTDVTDGAILTADLLQYLSIGESYPREGGGRDFAIAIQVPADRTAAWEKSWPSWINALRATRGEKVGTPQVARHNAWLLAVSDASRLPVDSTLRRLAGYPATPGALLQVDSSIPGTPAARIAFVTTNGNVRTTATVTTLKSLPTALPAWEIPSFIREPMIQFTAARGLDGLTAGWLDASRWTGGGWPNQLFIWGQPNVNMRFPFAAAQFDRPASFLDHLFKSLQSSFAPASPSPLYLGRILQTSNQVILAGSLPVSPVFQATENEAKPFVTFGVIPLVRTTNPPAPEMVQQMSRSNLLVYDLELTSESIKQWNALLQLPDLLEGRRGVMTFPGTTWLLAAGPKLGECVTTAAADGDRQVLVQRKSSIGLSGLELVLFTRWLDPTPPLRHHLTNSPAKPSKAP